MFYDYLLTVSLQVQNITDHSKTIQWESVYKRAFKSTELFLVQNGIINVLSNVNMIYYVLVRQTNQ